MQQNPYGSEQFKIVEVKDYPAILQVLNDRLPISGGIHNMALTMNKDVNEIKCFTLHGNLERNAVIMIIRVTQDFGQVISISLPPNFIVGHDLKEALHSTSVINWKSAHMFVGIETALSPLIVDIISSISGNKIDLMSTLSYWLNPNIIDEIGTKQQNDNIVSKELDIDKGVPFFMKNWAYAKSEGGMQDMISKNISIGVYENEEVVAAAILSSHGLIGPLLTAPNHRRKGYGLQAMLKLAKVMNEKGLNVVSTVAKENIMSNKLHEKLGMIVTHECDWIFNTPSIQHSDS